MTESVKKILVVGPSWVGDMVMAQSLTRLLNQINPNVIIDVVAPGWSKPLMARMPEVRQSIEMPLGHGEFNPGKRIKLGQSLIDEAYDQAIVLPYTWKSALLPFAAKIPKRTGFIGEARWGLLNDSRSLDKIALPMMVQRYVSLATDKQAPQNQVSQNQEYPFPKLRSDKSSQDAVLNKLNITQPDQQIIAFCPGAEYGPAKRWPARHFATLALALIAQDKQVWILGSAKDSDIAAEINQKTDGKCLDLSGKTSLEDVIDLLALADVAICNDSGLMHIAAAVETSLVALYGSSDPSFTPPLSKKVEIVSRNLDCSPCFKKTCPLEHLNCLNNLSTSQIMQSIDQLSNSETLENPNTQNKSEVVNA